VKVSKKYLLLLAVVAVLLVLLAKYARQTAFTALVLAGRSRVCSAGDALKEYWRKAGRGAALRDSVTEHLRLLESDAAGYELWKADGSTLWAPKGSAKMLPWLVTEMERGVYEDEAHRVQEGDVVLDCGAHIGLFTRRALSRGARLVIAVEPAPENLECLRRNLAAEINEGRVAVCAKGVWDHETSMSIHSVAGFSADDSFVEHPHGAMAEPEIPLTTIDGIVRELHLERVDFIKMNIEGAEQQALTGAGRTLAQFRPRLSVYAMHLPDDPTKIPAIARDAWPGYRMRCGDCYVDRDRLLILPGVIYLYP
jgi:FkbM family methyltransferase